MGFLERQSVRNERNQVRRTRKPEHTTTVPAGPVIRGNRASDEQSDANEGSVTLASGTVEKHRVERPARDCVETAFFTKNIGSIPRPGSPAGPASSDVVTDHHHGSEIMTAVETESEPRKIPGFNGESILVSIGTAPESIVSWSLSQNSAREDQSGTLSPARQHPLKQRPAEGPQWTGESTGAGDQTFVPLLTRDAALAAPVSPRNRPSTRDDRGIPDMANAFAIASDRTEIQTQKMKMVTRVGPGSMHHHRPSRDNLDTLSAVGSVLRRCYTSLQTMRADRGELPPPIDEMAPDVPSWSYHPQADRRRPSSSSSIFLRLHDMQRQTRDQPCTPQGSPGPVIQQPSLEMEYDDPPEAVSAQNPDALPRIGINPYYLPFRREDWMITDPTASQPGWQQSKGHTLDKPFHSSVDRSAVRRPASSDLSFRPSERQGLPRLPTRFERTRADPVQTVVGSADSASSIYDVEHCDRELRRSAGRLEPSESHDGPSASKAEESMSDVLSYGPSGSFGDNEIDEVVPVGGDFWLSQRLY